MPFLYAFRIPVPKCYDEERQSAPLWLVKVGMTMGNNDAVGLHDLFRRFYQIGDGIRKLFELSADVPFMTHNVAATPVKGRSQASLGGVGVAPAQSLEEFIAKQQRTHWRKSNFSRYEIPFRRGVDGGAYDDLLFIIALPASMSKKEVESLEGYARTLMGGSLRSLKPMAGVAIPLKFTWSEMIVMRPSLAEDMRDYFRSGVLHLERFMKLYCMCFLHASYLSSARSVRIEYVGSSAVTMLDEENADDANAGVSPVSRRLMFGGADEQLESKARLERLKELPNERYILAAVAAYDRFNLPAKGNWR